MDGVNSVNRNVAPESSRKSETTSNPMQALGAFLSALSDLPSTNSSSTPSSSSSPAASSTPAPSNEVAAAFLARPVYQFDRTRVSTATETLGETRGVTESQLILDKSDAGRSAENVRHELGRQTAAEQESTQRADRARDVLQTNRGREEQLNAQRDELNTFRSARQNEVQESQRQVDSDTGKIEQQTAAIQTAQNEGESSRSRIDQLDGQVQQSVQQRDQAGTDVASGEQQVQSLQSQISGLQQQAAQKPPGNSGSTPDKGAQKTDPNAPVPPKNSGWALAQQQLTSAQSQLTSAQQQVEEAKRRQQQAEQSIQQNQQAASAERQRLDGIRSDLDGRVQTRKNSQEQAQSNKQQLQQDLDSIKDLGSHKQDIDSQVGEIAANQEQARASLEKNQANAQAAHANAAQLENLDKQLQGEQNQPRKPGEAESTQSSGGRQTGSDRAFDSTIDSALDSAEGPGTRKADEPLRAQGRPPVGEGPSVQEQGDRRVVNLRALNQGLNGASQDTGGALARHRGAAQSDGDLGDASVAAAAAAAAASDSAQRDSDLSSPGRGPGGDGPPGLEKKGGVPPGQAKKGRG